MRNRLPSGCRLRWPDGDCVMDMALGQNTRAVGMAKPHIGFVLQGLGAGGSERIVSLLCNHFAAQGWTVTLFAFEDRVTTPYYPHLPTVLLLPLAIGKASGWERVCQS